MKITKEIVGVVLRNLGLASFGKDSEGKFTITEEQKTKLSGLFGQGFAREFAAALPEWDGKEVSTLPRPAAAIPGAAASGAAANTVVAAAASGAGTGTEAPAAVAAEADATETLMNALRGHHAEAVAIDLRNTQAALASERERNAALQVALDAMAASPEADPAAEMPVGAIAGKKGVKVAMKVDYNNPLYAAARAFLQSGMASDYSAATIDVGDLRTEFGKYLSQNANNLEIIKQLFNGFTSAQYFTPVVATTEYRAIRALITSVVQQFSAKWTPGGKAKFTPITIKNRRHKINFPIVPAEVLDSYMFKLYDEGLSPEQMPITKYVWDELIYPALLQDLELRMVYKGKFVDHSGTVAEGQAATPPEDAMDGLETILVDAKASGDKGILFFTKYANFNYKTATAQEILDFVNAFVDWISPMYKGMKMPIFCSDDFKRAYKRAYKKVWGSGAGVSGDFGDDRVDYSNNMLVAPDGMYGSPIIFSTPKQNMVSLRHKNEVPKVINDVQKHGYEVRIFGEFWFAVGFAIGEAVFAFVPAGYDPKAQITKSWGAADDYQEWQGEGSTSSAGGI